MDKTQRWEYLRYLEEASDRELARDRDLLEGAQRKLEQTGEEGRLIAWLLRQVIEEQDARQEVRRTSSR